MCVKLFVNNLQACILLFLGGASFGILTIFIMSLNGIVIGAIMEIVHKDHTPLFVAAAILPHGIFEIPAFIISGALGILLAQSLIAEWYGERGLRRVDAHAFGTHVPPVCPAAGRHRRMCRGFYYAGCHTFSSLRGHSMDDDAGTLPPKQDFSGWFNDILWRAEIMDVRYPVKGLYVWYPYGFAIRKFVYNRLRDLLDRDHQETLFPLLIPEQEFMKEAEHIKGFEDEVYWVTHGGTTPLDVKLALRPTSETAIYPMYALWLRSHADLPMKYYQIVNTFRYETKQTRPLIRLREITSFMESHTVHATWDEAEAQVEYELGLTKEFYDGLCIPITISKRPDWDKFPGADYTIAVDAIMPDGKTLQIGTVHHLGTHFSKTFCDQLRGQERGAAAGKPDLLRDLGAVHRRPHQHARR